MELAILKLVGFLRPITAIEFFAPGFDVAAIGFGALLLGALAIHGAVGKRLHLTEIDVCIVLFSLWCLAIYVVYFDTAHIADVMKLLLPMVGYVAAKNTMQQPEDYTRVLFWIIVGFVVPLGI